ncbi:MAG: DUF4292 domain-containing protein [Tannerellaceae bacterium]|nr:DUF4292 domain-containing protein [Tannerellaceae bacterium]
MERAFWLSSLLVLLVLSGCKVSRKLTAVNAGEVKESSEFFFSVQKQVFQYRTLSARIRMELNLPGKELSSRVDMKMVKDSAFQFSILPLLGMEVFRIEFNTDSVKVIDRMNKRYAIESYNALKGSLPVEFNFYNLQALFTNRMFVPGERDMTPRLYNRFKVKREGATTEALITDAMEMLYAFKADGDEKLLFTTVTDPSKRYALKWGYADFRPAEKQMFPMQMDAQVLDDGAPAGTVKIYFSRIQRNIPMDMDFSIPEKYKRITFADILKDLK